LLCRAAGSDAFPPFPASRQYADEKVRIEPNSFVGGFPALMIRKLVRKLNNLQCWHTETVQMILRTEGGTAEAIVRVLVEAGLAVAETEHGIDGYRTTSLAPAFGSATAAKPITRRTADRALSQLLERVDQVNGDRRFLAKVTKVIVFGSYLRADVDRLSDVDIAVELQPKVADRERLRELTHDRVEQLQMAGCRFRDWLEVEYWWHLEAFRFLKSRSRAISLIDYKVEKELVDKVPHKVLLSCPADVGAEPRRRPSKSPVRRRRPSGDCPF